MIFKRFAANLRAQNWFAIGVEFAIVVAGVFVGNWVNDWSQAKAQQREARRLLVEIQPTLQRMVDYAPSGKAYYASVGQYAKTALSGWSGDPRVGDSDFVIAAYQASQLRFINNDSALWANLLGADQVRAVQDPVLRRKVMLFLTAGTSGFQLPSTTEYRKNVRRVIPIDFQRRITATCGDRLSPNGRSVALPMTCALKLDPVDARAIAARLRDTPTLADDLNWHLAVLVNFEDFLTGTATSAGNLSRDIDAYVGEAPAPAPAP